MTYRNPVRTLKVKPVTPPRTRVRGSTTAITDQNNGRFITGNALPPGTTTGDLIVAVVASHANGASHTMDAGYTDGGFKLPLWTKAFAVPVASGTSPSLTVWTRVVASTDNLNQLGYAVQMNTASATYAMTLSLLVLPGATGLANPGLAQGPSPAQPLSVGTRSAGDTVLAFVASGTSTTGSSLAWAGALRGGPPTTPAWSTLAADNPGGASLLTGLVNPDWTDPQQYNALAGASSVSSLAWTLVPTP